MIDSPFWSAVFWHRFLSLFLSSFFLVLVLVRFPALQQKTKAASNRRSPKARSF